MDNNIDVLSELRKAHQLNDQVVLKAYISEEYFGIGYCRSTDENVSEADGGEVKREK